MRSMTSPFWKMRTVPLDWLTTTAMALVDLADRRAGPVAGAEALGEREVRVGGIDELGGFFDGAVAR